MPHRRSILQTVLLSPFNGRIVFFLPFVLAFLSQRSIFFQNELAKLTQEVQMQNDVLNAKQQGEMALKDER